MIETIQIILTSIVCYGIYRIAYSRGYDNGQHIGFTYGLWKASERKSLRMKPSIPAKKQYSLVD